MKRILSLVLILSSIITFLSGCANTDETLEIANNLNKSLNKLSSIVTNLDTIDTNYISNPDIISSREINTPSENKNKKTFILAFNNYSDNNDETIKNIIIKELQNKYLNDNGTCKYCKETYSCDEDGYCTNCKNAIICDENGNCYNCKSMLSFDENFMCSNCNKSTIVNKESTTENLSYTTEFLSSQEDSNNIENSYNQTINNNDNYNSEILESENNLTIENNNNEEYNIETQNSTNDINSNSETVKHDLLKTSEESIEIETNQSISHNDINESLDKNPKLQQNESSNTETTNNQTEDERIENLNVSNIENTTPKNTELNETTSLTEDSNILINNESTSLDNKNIDESYNEENKTSENQEKKSNDTKFYYYTRESFEPIQLRYKPRYISEFNESNINDQLSSYLNKVQKLYAMTEDAIEANTILNNCKHNLIDCINEVRELNKNIIDGTCDLNLQQLQALKNYTHDIKNTIKNLKSCNGDLSDEINNISNNTPTSIATSVEVLNSNYMQLINHIDTRITYHESALATLDQIKYLLNEAINSNNISNEDIDYLLHEFSINEDNETLSNETKNILNESNDNSNSTNNKEENENSTSSNLTTKKSFSNIDTYKNPTFPKKKNLLVDDNNYDNNDNNIDESDVFYTDTAKNNTTFPLENSDVITNNYNNGTAINDNIENGKNTDQNNIINTNNFTNSAGYNNSIITQNNLNNDDGYGGYYYSSDGEIHNNGMNNENEIGNNGNTLQNNMNRNNNVNTYGYNTMLDVLNQGTVNNGINTLNTKPNYVNSNIETL